ncbi:MAG: glycosyltransferase [Candidatus Scalindua sp.]
MKVDIITPFKMQWLEGYKKVFSQCSIFNSPFEFIDDGEIKIFMWCNQDTVDYVNKYGHLYKIVVFIRRYEYYTYWIENINWKNVDAVICVNDFIAEGIEQRANRVKPFVIYNGILPELWRYKERKHGKKIAMVGYINQKKNLPLAIQILSKLPKDYELHLAGEIQCYATMDYLSELSRSLKRTIVYHGHQDNINLWLDAIDANYVLNTAISEGNPNNIIEGMAKGIKPIVHCWAGAYEQFGEYVYRTIDDAVEMIVNGEYCSKEYREIVERKFGFKQYQKVKEVVDNL